MHRLLKSIAAMVAMGALLGLLGCDSDDGAAQEAEVVVAPVKRALAPQEQARFAATVVPATSSQLVSWRVREVGGGTITAAGLYTAPSTTGTYHVEAVSRADATLVGVATVTVTSSSTPTGWIYYLAGTESPLLKRIWRVRPNGNDNQQLTPALPIVSFTLDPDESHVAWASDLRNIGVMRIDGTSLRWITIQQTDHEPSWSPDGLRIAFVRRTALGGSVWDVAPDGADARQLRLNGGKNARWPSYDGTGTSIVFGEGLNSDDALWVMGADGSGAAAITGPNAFGRADVGPVFSPDGALVACYTGRWSAADRTDISTVTDAGASREQLTSADTEGGSSRMPSWSPTGLHMAFASNRQNNAWDLWVMESDGDTPTRLGVNNSTGVTVSNPVWR